MSKELLVVKAQNEVSVLADGQAYISQRKLAEVLGVNENTLFSFINRKHKNYNTSRGLDAFLVKSASSYFAFDSPKKSKLARELVDKFMEAGALMYLYHQANYIPVKPNYGLKALPSLSVEREALVKPVRRQHKVLMQLVEQGVASFSIQSRKFYSYLLTEHGRELGYTQNENGTIIEPTGEVS